MPTAQQKKKQKRDQAARQEGRDGDASAPQAALADGQEGALAAGPAEAQPAFIPSRCWAGTRPGYAFKKGRHGQGYYLDAVQQQQQQERQQRQQQRGERSKGKRAGTTQQQEKEYRQQLRQKYTHAPIGGAPAAAAQDKPQQVLPGRLKELKRQRQLAAAAGQLEGFSSEEEEEEAAAKAPPSKRLKALPGRLRKKLAKHRSTGGS
jgi:U3 small nucleolar RNA-associated protein 14